eukprot:gnl/Dysnectes_brevis/2441_a2908_2411.p1 GENE.gnl/Dysnectes_brevis/2441_a2908_2411~~gnl/Dysnectes_brevis/2441_a2908_2411.p1  ORF type:complete len:261 (+),score=5.44 gnl/Dysnectes_brevis/2441_a2908_2411:112-894(+)
MMNSNEPESIEIKYVQPTKRFELHNPSGLDVPNEISSFLLLLNETHSAKPTLPYTEAEHPFYDKISKIIESVRKFPDVPAYYGPYQPKRHPLWIFSYVVMALTIPSGLFVLFGIKFNDMNMILKSIIVLIYLSVCALSFYFVHITHNMDLERNIPACTLLNQCPIVAAAAVMAAYNGVMVLPTNTSTPLKMCLTVAGRGGESPVQGHRFIKLMLSEFSEFKSQFYLPYFTTLVAPWKDDNRWKQTSGITINFVEIERSAI